MLCAGSARVISHALVLHDTQAAFRRRMGRVYRHLLRGAMEAMGQCLAQVKACAEIGPHHDLP